MSVGDQINPTEEKHDLPKMTQNSAYFFYEQKVLAENPKLDPASYYEGNYYKTALQGLVNSDYQTMLAVDAPGPIVDGAIDLGNTASVQEKDSSTCTNQGTSAAGLTISDGSGSEAAYAPDRNCEWTLTSSNYVNIDITKLMSETPDDGLEFYDKDGDLLAAFTGRWDPSDLPDIRSSDEVTVKWTTNSYCLLYTSPSPRDQRGSRMPSSA